MDPLASGGFRLEGYALYFGALRAQVVQRCRRALNHDLNNAVQSVHSGLELLTKCLEPPGNARITPKQCIALLQQQFATLQANVNSLLTDLAAPPGEPEPVDLKQLVRSALTLLRHERTLSTARVELPEQLNAYGRPAVLRVLTLTLLLDAVDAAGRDGEIVINGSMADARSQLQVTVRLATAAVSEMPEPLVRAINALLDPENGRLDVRRTGDIRTATLTVPAQAADAASAQSSNAPLRILLVDRNADAAQSLAMLLQLEGYETRAADRISQVIPTIEAFRPDVLLLDTELAGEQAEQIAQAVRRHALRPRPLLAEVASSARRRNDAFEALFVRPVEWSEVHALLAARR